VVLAAVGGEVVGVGAVVADVAEWITSDREADACWLVASTLAPVIAHVYERKLFGASR
jgi:hypothetical protein